MTDEKTVDVRVRTFMPGDLCFPNATDPVESIRLVDSANLQVTLEKIVNPWEYILDKLRKEESKYRTEIREIERTLSLPSIEIMLKERAFHKSELTVKDGKIAIPEDDLGKCNWYKVAQDFVLVYNSLIDELFRMYPNEPWEKIKAPRLSTRARPDDSSDFPNCLNSWNTQFKETSSREWSGPIRFDIKLNLRKGPFFPITTDAKFDSEKLEHIHNSLKAIRQSRARLAIGWDYLYHATRYLDEGNIRNAVIDLDIAVDFAVRKYLRKVVALGEKYIDKILDKCSTGDLLLIAQTRAKNKSKLKTWGALRELHALRGTVTHKYQRRFSDKQLEKIEKARIGLISILRELGNN